MITKRTDELEPGDPGTKRTCELVPGDVISVGLQHRTVRNTVRLNTGWTVNLEPPGFPEHVPDRPGHEVWGIHGSAPSKLDLAVQHAQELADTYRAGAPYKISEALVDFHKLLDMFRAARG